MIIKMSSKRSSRSNRSKRLTPHLFPPPQRGGGLRRGLEQSEAVERLERFELIVKKGRVV
jgi:hypothetical protein